MQGRPAEKTNDAMTEFASETLQKLEAAFLQGMTNREACFLANISESLFYAVCKASPNLKERFEQLSENVKILAKRNLVEAINKGDVENSKWYLERKNKDEFSTRNELTGANGKDLVPDEEMKEKADAAISNFLNAKRSTEDTGSE